MGRISGCRTVGLLLCLLYAGCLRVGFPAAEQSDTSTLPPDGTTAEAGPTDAAADASRADAAADASRADAADASRADAADASPTDASGESAIDSGTGPTTGLVLSLPMTDNPSDGVDDVAGGGATAQCSNCPALVAGSYQFSGNQYIEIDPEPRFQNTNGFTVAIWAKPSAMGAFQVMASKLYGTAVANSWQLSLRPATSCADRFTYETTDGSGYQILEGADTVPTNRWWHVASTWDGNTRRLYLNGVLIASGGGTTLMDSGPIYLGCDWDNGAPTHLFHGALRDFRLYDRALDAAEIAQLTAGVVFDPPPAVPGAVTALVLVDAASDSDIGPLANPSTISVPAGGVNIRADVNGAPGSVRFGLDGNPSYRVESSAPFSLEGDTNGNYAPWNPTSGPHTITATPFCGSGAAGTMGSPFTVQLTVK